MVVLLFEFLGDVLSMAETHAEVLQFIQPIASAVFLNNVSDPLTAFGTDSSDDKILTPLSQITGFVYVDF